jgi:hypothetical protein
MIKKILFVILFKLCLLWPLSADGGTFFRYGTGVSRSSGMHTLTLGYEEKVIGPFITQLEGGIFSDSAGEGRRGSAFGTASIGIEATPGYFVLRSVHGIGAITSPDSMLGGWFQFNNDLLIGIQDDHGVIFGLNYKHISSAGINTPNLGRDMVLVHVEIPW